MGTLLRHFAKEIHENFSNTERVSSEFIIINNVTSKLPYSASVITEAEYVKKRLHFEL